MFLLDPIDEFLNNITMYRLVLYVLLAFLGFALFFSLLGAMSFSPLQILFSTTFILGVSYVSNKIFSWAYDAPTNLESVYITALILAVILRPANSFESLPLLFWASVLSMATKYIFAIGRKHLFNPAAIAAVLTAFAIGGSANWWIGTGVMFPVVLVGGFLVLRKMRKTDLALGFFGCAILTMVTFGILNGYNPLSTLQKIFLETPIIFFGTIMLTEPLTMPVTRSMRIVYGVLTGFLFAPQVHFGPIFSTPELALVVGNVFSYLVSPKIKLMLKLKEKIQLAPDEWDFVFSSDEKFSFIPGQYFEWTLSHKNPDSRGNRRYLSMASSPTEQDVRVGVKFAENSSSFKKALLAMNPSDEIVASQLSGEFVLANDPNRKYVFLAGGIGITPYRSIVKFLLDSNQKREIALFYGDKTEKELVYRDIFSQATGQIGMKNIYVLSEESQVPSGWQGKVGHVTGQLISDEVPDFKERYFYISGSHAVVVALEKEVRSLGVPGSQIKTDFFPGFV